MYRYKVYSTYSSESIPHLEATFKSEKEAQSYIECWQSLYSQMDLWIDAS